jgi:hypothetical protein
MRKGVNLQGCKNEFISLSCFIKIIYFSPPSNFHDFGLPKVFSIFDFGHFFCPFFENSKKSWRIFKFVTIKENYRLVTKIIIFIL